MMLYVWKVSCFVCLFDEDPVICDVMCGKYPVLVQEPNADSRVDPDIGSIWDFILFSVYRVSWDLKTICCPSPNPGEIFL